MAEVIHRYLRKGEKSPEPTKEQLEREESNARFAAARARKETALAELREAEAERRKGQLIEKSVAVHQATYLFIACRQRFLGLASSLPRKLVGKTQHEMKMIIDGQVRACLAELSELPDRVTQKQLDYFNESKNDRKSTEKRKTPRTEASGSPW